MFSYTGPCMESQIVLDMLGPCLWMGPPSQTMFDTLLEAVIEPFTPIFAHQVMMLPLKVCSGGYNFVSAPKRSSRS